MAVDGSNNVLVTGYSCWQLQATYYDYATIKYSSAGVPLWTNRYRRAGESSDYANAVAVDGNNNVIVTGYSGNGSGPITRRSSIRARACRSGPTATTGRGTGP